MQFTTSTIAAILLHTAPIFAATHKVNVGGNKQLTFTPTSVTAAVGDTVQYVFQDQNHTVTAGSPNAGCQPSGQFNSGFVPVPATGGGAQTTFSVQVQNTQPITVYCAQAQHCQVGMVMVINPSTTGATSLKAYTKLCAGAKTNTPAQGVNGGTLANPPAATTSTTGTTAAKGAKGAKGGKGGKKGGKKAAGAAGATGAGAGAASGAASGAGAGAGAGAATGGAAKGAAGAAGGAAPCAKGKKTARLLRA